MDGTPPEIMPRQLEIERVHAQTIGRPNIMPANEKPKSAPKLDDQIVLEKAKNARNGTEFQRLFDGHYEGYPSQSEADLALCGHLAFWTGGAAGQMDRLFRQSGLIRTKWDSRRGDETYGSQTIKRALETTHESYKPLDEVRAAIPHTETVIESQNPLLAGSLPKSGGVQETNFCPPTALEFVESIQEESIDWLLEGYLAKGSLVVWVAKPKTGKTTIIYQAARAVAEGRNFLGREAQKGSVLILAVEEHQRDVKLRLQDLGCDSSTNFFIHCQQTNPTAEFLHQLKSFVTENQIALIVIDTLANFWKLKDENDASAMTQAVAPLLHLARESGACVLMIHHSRKSEGEYGDEIRGSSALFGLVDVAVIMRNTAVKTQRKLVGRSRYPETPTELIVELREEEYVSLGNPEKVNFKARLEKMRGALSDTPEKAVVIIQRAGLKPRAGHRLLKWLTDHGEITRTGSGKKGSPYLYAKPNVIHVGSPPNKAGNEMENTDLFHAVGTGECMNHKEKQDQQKDGVPLVEEEILHVD